MPHGTGNPLFPHKAAEAFHKWYYRAADKTWRSNHWRGVPIHKSTNDLWAYQELLHQLQPALIIECGSLYGGSSLFFADICELHDRGHVLSIDIKLDDARPLHDRLSYHEGDTLAPETIARVREWAWMLAKSGHIMVVLDDDHRAEHVLEELRVYSHLVTPGSYLICEDTNLRHPVWPKHGPGPAEALAQWFAEDDPPFDPDPWWARHGFSFSPGGWLRRRS